MISRVGNLKTEVESFEAFQEPRKVILDWGPVGSKAPPRLLSLKDNQGLEVGSCSLIWSQKLNESCFWVAMNKEFISLGDINKYSKNQITSNCNYNFGKNYKFRNSEVQKHTSFRFEGPQPTEASWLFTPVITFGGGAWISLTNHTHVVVHWRSLIGQ